MSDLQAAAERVRRQNATNAVIEEYQCSRATIEEGNGTPFERDLEFLANAFLALTDPTPIDEAWLLKTLGIPNVSGQEFYWPQRSSCFSFHTGVKECEFQDREGRTIAVVTTRGRLNSLIHALKGE